MQNSVSSDGTVTEVDSSLCITSFNSFWTAKDGIDLQMIEDTYIAARELKGAGSGTHIGFLISNASLYQQVLISGFDFYNNCNIDYYMKALGVASQNVAGLTNIGTNLAFRVFSSSDTTFTDLVDAVSAYDLDETDDNMTAIGTAAGSLLITMLSVEIPTLSSDTISYIGTGSTFA